MNITTIEKHHKSLKKLEYSIEVDSAIERLCKLIGRKDFCFLPAARTRSVLQSIHQESLSDWEHFRQSWDDLVPDEYMADGGRYRKRRHATLSAVPSSRYAHSQPHQPHFQSLAYNNLNGGVARHYEPILPNILNGSTMRAFLGLGCEIFGRLAPYSPWHIEAHQFRIESNALESGKPTPEGVHQDGVNFVLMIMVKRSNLVNGTTTIHNRDKFRIDEFTLTDPLDMAIVNEERVLHGVTPIVQLKLDTPAVRDVLVLTFRRKY